MLKWKKSMGTILLIALSACSQSPGSSTEIAATPTLTPYAVETVTALAGSTPIPSALPTFSLSTPVDLSTAIPISYPTITPSVTPLVSLTPTVTPTAVALPSNFSPVLHGWKYDADTFFSLLGGVQGGQWLSAEQAAEQMRGAALYDVYTLAKGMFPVYGYTPEKSQISRDYFLNTDATLNEVGMLGVAHGWQIMQRGVDELPSTNELYQQVVTDWLSQAGVTDPQIGTLQIQRVDLEGDGVDEIFITATRVEGQHTVKPGDHSMILMRKVVGNEAVTVPILVDLYAALGYGNPFPCTYSIGNFIDLNQDGVLEVVVEFVRWEGFGASVYEVAGENVAEVLGSTCMTP